MPSRKPAHRYLTRRALLLLFLIPLFLFPLLYSTHGLTSHTCPQPTAPDGGDCQALSSPRRPPWACPDDMRAALPFFTSIYARRPHKNNVGGMRFDHSFALWYTLRALRPSPTVIIESGAFRGHSTWLMREALPNALIYSLDPRSPDAKLPGVRYMVQEDFKDFADVDWAALGVHPANTLVFVDDHQSGFRRVLREGAPRGFRRFIIEDNYQYLKGDNMSFKWVCERERRDKWPGVIRDNFGKRREPQTWEQHLALGDEMERRISLYYEFPPVAESSLSGQTRFDPKYSATPLVTDKAQYDKLMPTLNASELHMYTHFSYIEVKE